MNPTQIAKFLYRHLPEITLIELWSAFQSNPWTISDLNHFWQSKKSMLTKKGFNASSLCFKENSRKLADYAASRGFLIKQKGRTHQYSSPESQKKHFLNHSQTLERALDDCFASFPRSKRKPITTVNALSDELLPKERRLFRFKPDPIAVILAREYLIQVGESQVRPLTAFFRKFNDQLKTLLNVPSQLTQVPHATNLLDWLELFNFGVRKVQKANKTVVYKAVCIDSILPESSADLEGWLKEILEHCKNIYK
jgi:hypothetical protein